MTRWLPHLGFLLAILLVPALTHRYLWVRLVRDTALPEPWRRVATVALVVLSASLTLAFFLPRILSPSALRAFRWPAYVWMGLFFFLLVVVALGDGIRLVAWLASKISSGAAQGAERRLFLRRTVGAVATAFATGAGVLALWGARKRLVVKNVPVTLRRLPAALDGTTIVQITDMHVGDLLGRSFVEEVVRVVNTLDADVVVITGDLVDASVSHLRAAIAPLKGLSSKRGVFFVTGNHEYIVSLDARGAEEWIEELSRLGIRTLANERVSIGDADASFDLAGVHDSNAAGFTRGAHREDVSRALAGRDPSREVVLLAHQPRALAEAVRHGVGLQLSGHTHGGQIWPFGFLVALTQPILAGLGRRGETQIYVSRGTGFWGPPMRLGNPAEVTRIVLRSG